MNDTPSKSWLTEGVTIALIPVIGYAVAFAYQWGYANYFGIPPEVIAISISGVFIAGVLAGGLCFGLFFLSDVIYDLLPEKRNFVMARLVQYGDLYLISAFLLFISPPHWQFWLVPLCVVVAQLWDDFGRPLLTQRDKKSYEEKVTAQWQANDKRKPQIALVMSKYGRSNIRAVLLMIMLLLITFQVGHSVAMRRTFYLIDEQKPSTAILAIYGNRYVSTNYSNTNGVFSSVMRIAYLAEGSAMELSWKKIGPLKPEKK